MADTVQKRLDLTIPIAKRDEERQIAYGVVLEPRDAANPDTQGDFYGSIDVELAAHGFMKRVASGDGFGDLLHDGVTKVGVPVESYVAPVDFELGDQHVPAGAWVLGMHYPDRDIWEAIKDGRLSAFSVGGSGYREG